MILVTGEFDTISEAWGDFFDRYNPLLKHIDRWGAFPETKPSNDNLYSVSGQVATWKKSKKAPL